mgnify:CR=1 FL=1|tara:strand:- start:238 stop:396 length:159 start_codon:yes stop_codon:yes gene_type:complete
MDILLKYRFFVLMGISALLHYFYSDGDSDLAIIVFFIAILDLSNVLSKEDKQ